MPKIITESEVEEASLDMLEELGYKIIYGPDISEGGINEERKYNEVVLVQRLRNALQRINKDIPKEAIEEAIKKIKRTDSQNQIINNQSFHKFITEGVPVEYKTKDGIKHNYVQLFDLKEIKNNEFLAVNQFTIIEERNNRRPDILLFINGLPIVMIELKNPADENATTKSAFNQFQTYKQLIPSIFRYNEILVASDGLEAKAGTLTSNFEWFIPWKTIDGKKAGKTQPQIEVLTKGIYPKVLVNKEKYGNNNEYGITLVSLDNGFKTSFEPYSAPYTDRIEALKHLHDKGLKTWVSMEPYPTPNLVEQNLQKILSKIHFVDKIIFGKLNYNVISSQFKDNGIFYEDCARQIIEFCKNNNIDCHIKNGTQKTYNKNTEVLFERVCNPPLTV